MVREMHRPTIEKRGYFIEGKFDQMQRNVPYWGWRLAFAELANYMLTESNAQLARWKSNILRAVGDIGGVLLDVIPNLEPIIGPQPPVPELSAAEAGNRFNYVLQEFIRVVATGDHPLVVFLDDLQWIDPASLKLLQTLLTSGDISHLLIVGAYRDNEVDGNHPFVKAIEAMRGQAKIEEVVLGNLSEADVNALNADSLHYDTSEARPFTELIYSKTGGNAFFTRQTLSSLAEKQAITFDVERRRWEWDLSVLRSMDITDNVVTLMLTKIGQLPPDTQDILTLAACIGFQFDAFSLSIIARQPQDTVTGKLQKALREGLVVPFNGSYKFVHDRVQQAAYSMISEADKKAVHREIGELLLRNVTDQELEERLFTIIDHLDTGAELIESADERLELANLNLRAGRKAKASTAYSSAAKYLAVGTELLEPDSWDTHYELTYSLHKERVECEYLTLNYATADVLFNVVMQNAKTDIDKVNVYILKIERLFASLQYEEAVSTTRAALKLVGFNLPVRPSRLGNLLRLWYFRLRIRRNWVPALLELPTISDPRKEAVVDLLARLVAPTYWTDRNMRDWIILKSIGLFLRYGNTGSSPFLFAAYAGQIFGPRTGNYRLTSEIQDVALEIMARYTGAAYESKTYLMVGSTGALWTKPFDAALDILEKSYLSGRQSGDVLWSSYALQLQQMILLAKGVPLDKVYETSMRDMTYLQRAGDKSIIGRSVARMSLIRNLQGLTTGPRSLDTDAFDEQKAREDLIRINNQANLALYYTCKLQSLLHVQDIRRRRRYSQTRAVVHR